MYRTLMHALLAAGLIASAPAWADQAPPEILAGTCESCHGTDGDSHGPAIPTIAGLSKNFFIGTMLAFKYSEDIDNAYDVIDKDEALADVVVLKRSPSIMDPLAQGYTIGEIKTLAEYFGKKTFAGPHQKHDAAKADSGRRLHEAFCDKCHPDGGRDTSEDAGLLAGQWELYLRYMTADYLSGEREMIKKMKTKMKDLQKRKGDQAFEDLIQFYISEKR